MAVFAKDGSRHHSSSRASMHDEMGAKKAAPVSEMKKPEGLSHPAPSSHSIEDHVDTHGPAHKIEYTHDQASGEHHISSHHGEGEETSHHSKHKTHHAAHAHIAKAMGMQDEEQEERDSESPDEEYEEETTGSKGIPGLS